MDTTTTRSKTVVPDNESNIRLAHIFNAAAESLVDAEDNDVLDEARTEGSDPSAIKTSVQSILMESLKKKLKESKEKYQQSVRKLRQLDVQLPKSTDEQ